MGRKILSPGTIINIFFFFFSLFTLLISPSVTTAILVARYLESVCMLLFVTVGLSIRAGIIYATLLNGLLCNWKVCVCVCVLEIKGSRYWTCGIQFRLRKGCLKGFKVV